MGDSKTAPGSVGAGNGGKPRKVTSWMWPALVYAVSIGCLVWVYRDFDWESELPRLLKIHWSWILVGAACDVAVYFVQAWRWNLLLRPVAKPKLGRSVRAIYIGLFANELLPLRSGEAIRCYLQALWTGISFPVALSSAIIERLIDGVLLIIGFYLTTFAVELPDQMEYGAAVLAALVTALLGLLIYAVHRKDEAHDALAKHRWLSVLRHLIEGLHAMGKSRTIWLAALASIPYLLLQVVPLYAMMRGYEVDLPISAAAVTLVILRLGTVIPGPPGNIGFFNAFAVAALTLQGVDHQTAKGLSGVMFFIVTVPLLLGGCVALMVTGMNVMELQAHARRHMSGQHTNPDGVPVAKDQTVVKERTDP